MLLDLRDPYGLGRDQTITVDTARRAALAECRAEQARRLLHPPADRHPHGLRWIRGQARACADHDQDARLADVRLTMADR